MFLSKQDHIYFIFFSDGRSPSWSSMEFSARMMDYMNARLATKADNSSNLVTYRYAHLVETHDFDIFFCSLKFLNKCSVVKNSAYFLSMCNSKRHTDFDIRYHEGIFFYWKSFGDGSSSSLLNFQLFFYLPQDLGTIFYYF